MSQKANPVIQTKDEKQSIKTNEPHGTSTEAQQILDAQFALADPGNAQPGGLLNLQRIGGNQAVLRLLQTKLTVGAADDPYEREADRMADAVMSMPAPSQGTQSAQRAAEDEDEIQTKPLAESITSGVLRAAAEEEEVQTKPILQREGPEEEEEPLQMKADVQREGPEEEEEPLQMKPALQREQPEEEEELPVQGKLDGDPMGSFDTGTEIERQIEASRGSGSPMPDGLRGDMESRFGADFSGVQIHTGGEASQLNRALSAQAFTTGSDIYMGEGKYSPGTDEGQHLLAHELTHVIQQHPGRKLSRKQISRKPTNLIQRGFLGRLWAWFKHKVDITNQSDYYLWKKKESNPTKLIISSHGGYDPSDGNVAAPSEIKFMAAPDQTTDKQLGDINSVEEDVAKGTQVPDYELSKYQGYHGGDAETYQDVASFVETNDDYAILSVKGGSEIKYSNILGIMGGYSTIYALHCRVNVNP
jgi:hypothetical protein